MYDNSLFETPSEGLELKIRYRSEAARERVEGLRGAVLWVGRGYKGDRDVVTTIDGLARLTGIYFDQGKSVLKSKYVHDSRYFEALKRRRVPNDVTLNPRSSWRPWHIVSSVFRSQGGALDIQRIHGRDFVTYEGADYLVEIDVGTLEVVQPHSTRRFTGELPTHLRLGHAEYPYVRALDRHVFISLLINPFRWRATLAAYALGRDWSAGPLFQTDLSHIIDFHSFAVTDRHLVFIQNPERIDLARLVQRGNLVESLVDQQRVMNRFIVFDHAEGRIVDLIDSSHHFSFNHIFKASTAGRVISIDLIESSNYRDRIVFADKVDDRHLMYGRPVRYHIDLARRRVDREPLWDQLCEMPYVDDAGHGDTIANYFCDRDGTQFWGLCNLDRKLSWTEDDYIMSSPVVKGGVCFCISCDRRFTEFKLLMLDVESLSVLGEASLPMTIGMVAHGKWLDPA